MDESVSKRTRKPAESRAENGNGSNRAKKPSASLMVVKPPEVLPFDFSPRPIDIVCGRGKASTRHNMRYTDLLRHNSLPYKQAQRKSERSGIIANVVATLRAEGSMFVKFDEDSTRWYDIGDKEARKKCGHAIRDRLNLDGNPVRGTKVKAAAAKKQSARDSKDRPKRRGRRQQKQPPQVGNPKDDTDSADMDSATDTAARNDCGRRGTD